MSQGFFNSVKKFFNSKTTSNVSPPPLPTKTDAPRIVSFGGNEQSLKKESAEEEVDLRYEKVEAKQSWKELGVKKDEVAEGEIPILVDSKFVRSKTIYGQYEEVTFILSNYQIMLKLNTSGLIRFPLGKIEKLHKYTNNENHFKLLIGLKDGRLFKFRINTELMWKKIYDCIQKFAFVRVKKHFFAFRHFEANRQLEENFRGWQSYDLVNEFKRMGVELMPHTEDPVGDYWSNYKVLNNRDGKICPTYPEKIIVPSRISYDCLVRCSKFRSRNRMPALTYLYKHENGKFVGIYRSSQSKVGVSNSRSPDDELMLRLIGNPELEKDQSEPNVNCIIFDARNKMAAFGNKVAGKGYQSQQFYPNCKVEFLNIPNIHAVRESYNKTIKAALGDDSRFYINLAESEWYDFVFLIIEGAIQVARTLTQGKNVLIHCSDGWDRTSQLCALAQLLLDPYYRTIVGFQNLIEKDWMRFGHQFAIRMGQGVNNPTGEEKSPIFLQFLDCVSQLIYQYPTDFQFNYRYLQEMAELSQTNLFGNFLCNCELQMKNHGIESKTVSLWSYFFKNREIFVNPFYFQAHEHLHPSAAQKHFRFWKEHFLQFVEQFQDIYDIYSCKFTEDNLEIMYKHLKQEKILLQEKLNENKLSLDQTNREISRLNDDEKKEEEAKEQANV